MLILEEQIISTQTMKGSTYAKQFKKELATHEDWLIFTMDFLELWVKV